MLRRVEKFTVKLERYGLGGRKSRLVVWTNQLWVRERIEPAEFQQLKDEQRSRPVLIARSAPRRYWWFRDRLYWENDGLAQGEVEALLLDRERKRKRKVERAEAAANVPQETRPETREAIPDDVKMFVWQRDGGTCVRCGTNEKLEFDHIIPRAMGGSNTARNLQLLCEPCNRAKGANLT